MALRGFLDALPKFQTQGNFGQLGDPGGGRNAAAGAPVSLQPTGGGRGMRRPGNIGFLDVGNTLERKYDILEMNARANQLGSQASYENAATARGLAPFEAGRAVAQTDIGRKNALTDWFGTLSADRARQNQTALGWAAENRAGEEYQDRRAANLKLGEALAALWGIESEPSARDTPSWFR